MATLVLLKEKGLPAADIFRGTFNGPDDNPSEWDYLTRDGRWQARLSFSILEYVESSKLPVYYASKIRKAPQLFLELPGSQPLEYKDKLVYPFIQNWITKNLDNLLEQSSGSEDAPPLVSYLENIPAVEPKTSPVLAPVVPSQTAPTSAVPAESKTAPEAAPSESSQSVPERGVSVPGAVLGGGLILFGFAVLGAIMGTVLAPDEDNSNQGVGLLAADDDGTPIDFKSVDWDEEVKPRHHRGARALIVGSKPGSRIILKPDSFSILAVGLLCGSKRVFQEAT
jgi:hypothetical protein